MPDPSALPWDRPLGATACGDGTVTFRCWSPAAEGGVELELRGERVGLDAEGLGVHATTVPAAHGDRYAFVVGGEALPDPQTHWQPDGIRGASAVVDPGTWTWEHDRPGVALADLVVYELHVGTFTPEGTFDAAIGRLERLRDLGITAIELLPVAEFPGAFGWGYDGVQPAAVHHAYGGPDGLQRLVDAAHGLGLAVVLDVVPNHVGASGEQALRAFGPYFTGKYSTFWGGAINYDDEGSDAVREWMCQACEWFVRDLRIDGLRLDAIHAVFDQRPEHLVAELARRVHEIDPRTLVIAESGLNDPKVVTPQARGGWGCDAAWADDLHHCLRTLVSDEREGYYEEFGTIADLCGTLRDPHHHKGQFSTFRGRRFGAPAADVDPARFVVFCQDHDQVGNRAFGDRLEGDALRLAAFVVLLSPFTPMLFMGEEHGDPAPFQFFADHIDEEIAVATRDGRRREFSAFASFAGEDVPDPLDRATFERSKLTWQEDATTLDLYRSLLAVRRELPPGPVDEASGDEEGRWARFDRGRFRAVAAFAQEGETAVEAPSGARLRLATGTAELHDGRLVLGPRSGALLELAA